jgi:PknH-like extracellular domain
MLVIGRVARVTVALFALAAFAGCSNDKNPAPDSAMLDVNEMRGALLQATDIGPTWTAPGDSAEADASAAPNDPNKLVSICGGTTTAPPVPPGGTVVAAPFVDEGEAGAQTLNQTAIVYGDPSAAQAGLTALRTLAGNCPATVNVPATVTSDKSEPAYTETVKFQPLTQGAWTGFAVVRHKQYEPKHPGTADTSVAVLATRNVLLVDSYAIYRIGTSAATANPSFGTDWPKLVGTVVNNVG